MDPAARAARMREGDHHRTPSIIRELVLRPDELGERPRPEKAVDRQATDGDEQRRADDPKLVVQPAGAALTLGRAGHAVASTAGVRARIAAGDGRDVEPVARSGLVEASSLQPLK